MDTLWDFVCYLRVPLNLWNQLAKKVLIDRVVWILAKESPSCFPAEVWKSILNLEFRLQRVQSRTLKHPGSSQRRWNLLRTITEHDLGQPVILNIRRLEGVLNIHTKPQISVNWLDHPLRLHWKMNHPWILPRWITKRPVQTLLNQLFPSELWKSLVLSLRLYKFIPHKIASIILEHKCRVRYQVSRKV